MARLSQGLAEAAAKIGLTLLIAAVLALPAFGQATPVGDAGPRFRADGPQADVYGRADSYPVCPGLDYMRELRCRVGTFSAFDKYYPARLIAAATAASPLRRSASEPAIRYSYYGESRTLDQYLDRQHVTGLLIAKGDTILVERYQYGRTDKDRLTSFSMAKSIVGLLIGIAIAEGKIASIDDLAEKYVVGLKDTEYGRTPIKALLEMASGVWFREVYTDDTSDVYILARGALGGNPGGGLATVRQFNTRHAKPRERFSYSSAETLVLGLVLAAATGRTVADYAAEKLWQPIGAEAAASWVIDAVGQEVTFAYFNAVLRDWARLGLMLAHDGAWNGKIVVPRDWVLASTTIQPGSPLWAPSLANGQWSSGYGYQIWLLLAKHRTFALRGLRGQFVIVDPETKIVLVQTALQDGDAQELYALFDALAAQLP